MKVVNNFCRTIALGAILVGVAHAGVTRHDVGDLVHLNWGAQPQFDGVGFLPDPSTGAGGSGTMLTDEWLLTAAHVTDVMSPAGGFYFELGGTRHEFAEIHAHPLWRGTTNITQGWDLALVRLSEPVPDVPHAQIYAGDDLLSQESVLAGYGLSGTGFTGGQPGTFGTKRAGPNTFDGTGDQFIIGANPMALVADFDAPQTEVFNKTGSPIPLENEFFPGLGDSGGAYWVEQGGMLKLGSIQSWGLGFGFGPNYGSYGDVAMSWPIAAALDWIEGITGVPEPSAFVLLVAPLLIMHRRRAA